MPDHKSSGALASAGLKAMMEYVVIVEKANDGSYSAYVPDLPGCVSCGESVEEVQELIAEAISAHVDSLRRHGESVPSPSSKSFLVNAA